MESPIDATIDLKHYFRVVWRRKGLILLCSVCALCATIIALSFVPREYESQVTLRIEDSRVLSKDLERIMGGIMRPSTQRRGIDEERMAGLVGRIRSRPFLERVIRMVGMNEDPIVRKMATERQRDHPAISADEMAIRILVKNLQSRIRFGTPGKGIYTVTVADYKAEYAQTLAKWTSELFVTVSNESVIERLKAAHDFGVEQLRIYEEQLRRSEETLERYRQSIIEKDLARSVIDNDNLMLAEALQRRIGDEIANTKTRLEALSGRRPELGVTTEIAAVFENPQIQEQAKGLKTSLKNELLDRLSNSTREVGTWPPPTGNFPVLRRGFLQQVETEVTETCAGLGADVSGWVSRFVFATVDLEAHQETAAVLRNAISEFRHQAEAMPGGEIELTGLENQVATNRELLHSFQAQLVASDISQAVEMTKLGTRIEILDPASLPLAASRPNRTKILLASLFLGPLIGVGLAFVGETLDRTLRTARDFARVVPEPILGTTPLLSRIVTRRRWIRRHWVPAALAGVVLLTAVFFVVRTNLLANLARAGQPIQVVDPESAHSENA